MSEEVCKCLEKVILENHIGNSTKVILCGGQITAWKNEHGEEFIFFSSKDFCCCHGSCGCGRGGETVSSGPKIVVEPQPQNISSSTTEIVEELQLAPHVAPHLLHQPLPDPHAAPHPVPHLAAHLAHKHIRLQMLHRIQHMLHHSRRPPQSAPHAALQLATQPAPRPVHFWLPILNHIQLMLQHFRLPMLHHSQHPTLPGPRAAPQLAPHTAPTWTRLAKQILVGFMIMGYIGSFVSYTKTRSFKNVGRNNVWLIPCATLAPFLGYGPTYIQESYQLGPKGRSIVMSFTALVSALTAAGSVLLATHLDGASGFWAVGFCQAVVIFARAAFGEYADCGFSEMVHAIFLAKVREKFHNIFVLISISYCCYLLRLGGRHIIDESDRVTHQVTLSGFSIRMKNNLQLLQNILEERGMENVPPFEEMKETMADFDRYFINSKKEGE